jgi:hypothetical protein
LSNLKSSQKKIPQFLAIVWSFPKRHHMCHQSLTPTNALYVIFLNHDATRGFKSHKWNIILSMPSTLEKAIDFVYILKWHLVLA